MTAQLTGDSVATRKSELLKAIAHPARIRALEVLATGPRSVGQLQPDVGIELSHLSQQLAILRRAGLVNGRKEGNNVIYSIKDTTLVELLAVARKLLVNTLTETRELLSDLGDNQ